MKRSPTKGTRQFAVEFQKICDLMAATRPTALNLFWAIDRMKRAFADGAQAAGSPDEIRARLHPEAKAIHAEDRANGPAMGGDGAEMGKDGARGLTHFNAGRLA